jgi:diguanylate cyclase (GGDEF)-like protein
LRGLLATWALCFVTITAPAASETIESGFEIELLGTAAARAASPGAAPSFPGADAVTSGALDSYFEQFTGRKLAAGGAPVWLRLRAVKPFSPAGVPVVIIHTARQAHVELYGSRARAPLFRATSLPGFGGTQDAVFVLPDGLPSGQSVYVWVDVRGSGSAVRISTGTLDETLQRGAQHARMISLAFGALSAMALASLLIWFILSDRLFVLYSTFFALQALYVVYLSGQGFDWPLLWYARPLTSFAWNVPVSLSGAIGCLFVREIADLRRFSPRVDAIFGWFAVAFVVVTLANAAKLFGYGPAVAALGNVVFSTACLFTLVVAFLAWRGGNQAAGWFLIAWGLLEGFAITAAVRFLFASSDGTDTTLLYYYGLPLSMVAAAVLIALGVAVRLREQRAALTDAELRAQTDPLTGVLNRRSLIERLDAACVRARARGLPIALLFIDLDHFKLINDSYGHQAGDACLRAIIEPIHTELRQSDVIGRYGGEEFVVILSGADASAAHPIAQRILERVASVQVDGFGAVIQMTCSIGIAASDTLGVWGEHLIAHADAAVYLAKHGGRNQVQMAARRP